MLAFSFSPAFVRYKAIAEKRAESRCNISSSSEDIVQLGRGKTSRRRFSR